MKLRTPSLTFERMKISVVIVVYALLAEFVDPQSFMQSSFGRFLWAALLLEFIRQAWVYRLEVSRQHVQRSQDLRTRWDRFRSRFSVNARFRIRRALAILASAYAFGLILSGLTDRCDGAIQCAILAPKIAIENLPMALQVAFYMAIGLVQIGGMFYLMTKVGFVKIIMPGTIDVTFDDIYGQDEGKAKIQEQVALLEDAGAIEAAGGYMPKGVLVWGPPGTGKTMLAKAAANASTKPLILIPPGAFASTFVGINFLKVWQLFRLIRKYALRHDGVIVFFDEIDSLGSRGGVADELTVQQPLGCTVLLTLDPVIMTGSGGMNEGTLAAFLAGMDGMDEPRGMLNRFLALLGFAPLAAPKYRYMMLGATNRPEALDPALRRAGRFGRDMHIGFPKFEGKLATFEGYLGKVSHEITQEEVEWSARNLDKGTGASIQDIVNEALLIAFRDDRNSITFSDLMSAMLWKLLGEGEGLKEVDEDNWLVAVHEAGHAVAGHYLRQDYLRIWVGSIESRGNTGGMIASTPVAERPVKLRSAMLADVAVNLASRVSEQLVLGEMGNGHAGDGLSATDTAGYMVRGGLGSTLSSLFLDERDTGAYEDQIEEVLTEALTLADEILRPRKDQVRAVANLLIDSGGTVQGDEIHTLLDRLEGGDDE